MTRKEQRTATPRLRFPEFRNAHPWPETPLNAILFEHGEKNDGKSEVHSVSVHKGVVNQVEHLGRSFAAADRSNYNLAKPHDIIYTKSPTGDFPYGIVKQSRLPYNVIVSPLYGVFSPINRYLGHILDAYFESPIRTNNYLAPITQKGAKNTIQISNDTFLSKGLYLPPSESEHKKIAECLGTLDELIDAESRKLDALKDYKKGLMQQLFPREGETRPRLRFPEFRSSGDWKPGKLGNEIQLISGTHLKPDQYGIVGEVPYFSGPSDFTNDVGGVTKWTNRSTSMAFPNNILITVKGSGVGELWFSTLPAVALGRQLMAIRSKGASIQFIYQLLLTKKAQFQRLGAGNLIPGLSRSDILEMQVYFPKQSEQKRIASCLSSLDEVIEEQGKKLEALRTHKSGLIQQLFPNPSELES